MSKVRGVNTPRGIKITGLLNAMCAMCSVMFVVAFLIPRQSAIVALLGHVETSCLSTAICRLPELEYSESQRNVILFNGRITGQYRLRDGQLCDKGL